MNARSRALLSVALTLAFTVPALGQELQGTLRKIKDSGTITLLLLMYGLHALPE